MGDKEDVCNERRDDGVSDEDREEERDVISQDFGPKIYLNDFSKGWKQRQADHFLESQKVGTTVFALLKFRNFDLPLTSFSPLRRKNQRL